MPLLTTPLRCAVLKQKKWIFITLLIMLILLPSSLAAESLTLDLGNPSSGMTGRLLQLLIGFTVLSLAPSIVIMVTSFTRIVIVFSFLRNAIGLQQSPPNVVLASLALFLTGFIMAPTLEEAYKEGLQPLIDQKIDEGQAFEKTFVPLRRFMIKNIREKDLKLFMDLAKLGEVDSPEVLPYKVVVPAFIISELRRAFEIGFLLFLPFLVIDLVIASILMAMGMMMLPPVMISLPFKVIFFVLVDGWYLLCGSLVHSFK
ncbi:MAG: flagellar type III secretion system pore protein FliP [Alphaproteobacteria bacterium]|nr:flagellar type III secretion system pore protein FliP [Alphaproteobacteria bacterium]